MRFTQSCLLCVLCASVVNPSFAVDAGFGEADITPVVAGKRVFIAGFGKDRPATGVLDPLAVRAFVLRDGNTKIAFATADVVGLFRPSIERVRAQLPGFTFIAVSATHNHHGPDTMGLWGPNAFTSGIDPDYLRLIETRTVEAIRAADAALAPVSPKIGTVKAPELLHDGRKPIVLHDDLVVLDLRPAGIVVQWNCHPETLDSKNPKVSADFVGGTVKALRTKYACPVAYISGTLGGMMTSMHVDIHDARGVRLPEGSVEKMRRYAELLAKRCDEALTSAKPLTLTPFVVRSRSVALPVDNPLYKLAKVLKVLDRAMEKWTGDPYQPQADVAEPSGDRMAVRSEVGYLRLGDLDVAVIPGEIYPELVVGGVQNPADPGADFPDAPIEPGIYAQLKRPYRMIVGLGNDELGYILPKRQWDEKPPYTYGAKSAPYGEINSLGPDTAPLICKVFAELAKKN